MLPVYISCQRLQAENSCLHLEGTEGVVMWKETLFLLWADYLEVSYVYYYNHVQYTIEVSQSITQNLYSDLKTLLGGCYWR